MTPAQLNLCAKAVAQRRDSEEKAARAKIYLLSSLIRTMIWSKHPPSYEESFPNDIERREMTDEEMFAQVQMLNALFGGGEI